MGHGTPVRHWLCGGAAWLFVLATSTVVAAPPVLDPVNDTFALPEFDWPAQLTITAFDPDPGDVVGFELIDPTDATPSPLDAYLTVQPPDGTTHSAIFLWDALATEAGIYPLRVVATDGAGNADQADFVVTVWPRYDDVTIHAIDGPTIVPVNSVENPTPYTFTVDATSMAGLELQYEFATFSPGNLAVTIPYQSSNVFDVALDEVGLWSLVAYVKNDLSLGGPAALVRTAFAYEPGGEVTPPGAPATLELTGPGRITASWPSNPSNTTITEYRLTLRTVADISTPVLDTVPVPDPADEPAHYQFTYDFLDSTRPELLRLIDDVNSAFSNSTNSELSQTTLEIEAVTGDPGQPAVFLPIGPVILLREQFPHLTSISTEVDLEPRAVTVTLGELVLPGGFYSADEVRIYRDAFESDPTLYQAIPDPSAGTRVTLVDAFDEPVPSGNASGELFATVIDQGIPTRPDIEGVLVKHTMALDPPQCWDGVDNDADGLRDLDGADPGCSGQLDRLEYDVADTVDMSDRALIVYNVNTTDAGSLAEHYRGGRGLPAESLCPVELPPGNFADPSQLLGARKTIVETCICRNVMGLFDFECDGISADTLSAYSPVTHLVLIKGIPHRLIDNGWPQGGEKPSFDYYLAHLIYNEPTIFDEGETGHTVHGPYDGAAADTIDYQPQSTLYARARPIDPRVDRMVAYGRVEALDTARTIDLIDRTLAAEAQGITGNLLEQGNVGHWEFLARLTTTRDRPFAGVVCDADDYLGVPNAEWPYAECRAGTTAAGLLPGEPPNSGKVQNIPYAINAGAYFGRGLIPGGHNAFRGFDNLLEWRLEHPDDQTTPCEPLCRDHPDPQREADCRATSTDFFREIDTSCVGVAPGFLGWQLRSWPVQYYGFQPSGWALNDNGAQGKTMPYPMTGSPFGDGYVHYGALDAATTPTCTPAEENAGPVACEERLAIDLMQTLNFDPAVELTADRDYTARFKYRRGGGSTGWVRVQAQFVRDDNEIFPVHVDYGLADPQPDWTEAAMTLAAPFDSSPVVRIRFFITAVIGTRMRGWLDLDHVELFAADDPAETNLLPADAASFEMPYLGPSYGGDWAANAIDRLGGIAWWGSGSHFQTGGWAFSEVGKTIGAFFAGRTLGEALLVTGGRARSGTIYGDPLYRPSGAKLYLDDGLEWLNAEPGYTFFEGDRATWDPQIHRLRINAFHGHANLGTTRWAVSRCADHDIDACFESDGWVEVESNLDHDVNAVFAHALQVDLPDLIDPDAYFRDQDILLRLRVWNPAQESDSGGVETHVNDLTSYGFLHYVAADNHAPAVENLAIAPAPPSVTEELVATYEFRDVDGDDENGAGRSVSWFVDGIAEPSLEGQLVVPAVMTSVGESWHVEVMVADETLSSPPVSSAPVTVDCLGPEAEVAITMVELDLNGDVRLHVTDPNPTTRVTGYVIARAGEAAGPLSPIATDLPDEDPATPGVQLTDVGSAPAAPLFYRIRAISTLCDVDGP